MRRQRTVRGLLEQRVEILAVTAFCDDADLDFAVGQKCRQINFTVDQVWRQYLAILLTHHQTITDNAKRRREKAIHCVRSLLQISDGSQVKVGSCSICMPGRD